jgi:hypothetical protein
MAELNQILNTALRKTVKEVVLKEINILTGKIESLNELVGR